MMRPPKDSLHSRFRSTEDGETAGFLSTLSIREVLPEITRMMIVFTLMENESDRDNIYRKSLKRLCFLTGLRVEDVSDVVSDLIASCVVEDLEGGAYRLTGGECLHETIRKYRV